MWRLDMAQISTRNRFHLVHLLLILCFILFVPVLAQANEALAGKWTGSFKLTDGQRLTTEIDLTEVTVYRWSGSIRVLAGTEEVELDLVNLRVSGTTVSYSFQLESMSAPAYFRGRYNPGRRQIRGTYTVSGQEIGIVYKRIEDALPSFQPSTGDSASYETDLSAILPPRHDSRFGIAVRGSFWQPMHIIKERTRNINDVSTSSWGYDIGARWYVIDGMAIIGRYIQGGLNFDNEAEYLQQTGLTGTEYEQISGFELAINAYLGDKLVPKSKFNPYMTCAIGKYNWALQEDGRGSDAVTLTGERSELDSTCIGVAGGIGTEYKHSERFLFEAEWLWRYFTTEDEELSGDITTGWTNTHAWTLTIGAVIGF